MWRNIVFLVIAAVACCGICYALAPVSAGVVGASSSALAQHAPGNSAPPSDPAARRALAKSLLAELLGSNNFILSPDPTIRRRLRELGPDAFDVLLPRVRESVMLMQTNEDLQTGCDDEDWIMLLGESLTPSRTQAVIDLLKLIKRRRWYSAFDGRTFVLRVLAAEPDSSTDNWQIGQSDPALTLPVMLAELRNIPPSFPDRGRDTGFDVPIRYIARSNAPEAIAVLRAALANPKADYEIRHAAAMALPDHLGADALPLLAQVHEAGRRRTRSFVDVLKLDELPPPTASWREHWRARRVLSIRRDRAGRAWALIDGGALMRGDLWITRWNGKRWVDPVFTGEELTSDPKTSEQILPRNWLERFAGNPALRTDTDGDGFTDVVERTLQTDPNRADTDGDGLIDSIDANPRIAPRPVTDSEAVLAAAFEDCVRFRPQPASMALHLPAGIGPIEWRGWTGILIAAPSEMPGNETRPTSPYPSPHLMARFPKVGVNFVPPALLAGLVEHEPVEDAPERAAFRAKRSVAECIVWSDDRSEAYVGVVTDYGEAHGEAYYIRVRRIGDDWIATGETPVRNF